MTTVHGRFFSNSNKEYVSTAVFQNVKEELGVELDATFVENLMKIMAETYSKQERPRNTNVEDYVDMLNEIVVQRCAEKVKTTSENVDYNKLSKRAAEERDYEFTKKDLKPSSSPNVPEYDPNPPPSVQNEPNNTINEYNFNSQIQAQMTVSLDFRKDLIDVEDNNYCLKLHKEALITGISIKKFMIELCDVIVSEPYIFIDILNIDDDEKTCMVEDKKVIGRMVQQSNTVCNKSMYLYEQEDCNIELKNPIKTNHLYFSFYDYNGTKINLKKINAKRVIKLEKKELNQILTNGVNAVKPGDTINVVTPISVTKETKKTYWQHSEVYVSESKSNSIICTALPSLAEKSKLILEKKILNSNISLAIFYKN